MAEPKKVMVEVPEGIAGLVEQVAGYACNGRWGTFEFELQEGAPVGSLRMKLTEAIKGAQPRR